MQVCILTSKFGLAVHTCCFRIDLRASLSPSTPLRRIRCRDRQRVQIRRFLQEIFFSLLCLFCCILLVVCDTTEICESTALQPIQVVAVGQVRKTRFSEFRPLQLQYQTAMHIVPPAPDVYLNHQRTLFAQQTSFRPFCGAHAERSIHSKTTIRAVQQTGAELACNV